MTKIVSAWLIQKSGLHNLYQNYYMVMATADPLAILSSQAATELIGREEPASNQEEAATDNASTTLPLLGALFLETNLNFRAIFDRNFSLNKSYRIFDIFDEKLARWRL